MERGEKGKEVGMALGIQLFLLLELAAVQKDQPEVPDLKQLMEQLAGWERLEKQALKVWEHLDLPYEQAQAQQGIARPDLADNHPP